MVFLAASSAIVAPIALGGLLPLVMGSASVPMEMETGKIAAMLLLTQLLPLCLGIAIRHLWPDVGVKLQPCAALVSKGLNLITISVILTAHFDLLSEIRARGFVGMAVLLMVSWTAGWLSGGPTTDTRRALAVTTSLRNFGVGLVIATNGFAGTPAVTALIAYGMVSLFGTLALATWSAGSRGTRPAS
jgi:BASS family bile acid:Na+ symporter